MASMRLALALGSVVATFATDRVAPAFSVSLDEKPEVSRLSLKNPRSLQ
jgi:hypothetical protein